ncbi:conserved hypothetical protein [Ricinus communis]|uniref:Uncharacterized protein n=1 Tax=Ricinus communis TaxID=3988 RepID=B9SWZ2_RICCO|nr:conserved hypothetical protein [Ricinus communis]
MIATPFHTGGGEQPMVELGGGDEEYQLWIMATSNDSNIIDDFFFLVLMMITDRFGGMTMDGFWCSGGDRGES